MGTLELLRWPNLNLLAQHSRTVVQQLMGGGGVGLLGDWDGLFRRTLNFEPNDMPGYIAV